MAQKTSRRTTANRKSKRGPLVVLGILVLGAGAVAAYDQFGPGTIEKNTTIEGIDVSGLTREEAKAKLAEWAAQETKKTLVLETEKFDLAKTVSYAEAGVVVDVDSSIRQLPIHGALRALVNRSEQSRNFDAIYRIDRPPVEEWAREVLEKRPEVAPARARFVGGRVVTTPEVTTWELDKPRVAEAVLAAVQGDQVVRLPLVGAPLRVSDERLAEIKTVVSEFTTRFNAGQVARSANIRRAAEIIDGVILLPGETWSFNDRVGQRTTARGFRVAGVYVSGRHDFDVGGGICQVSTTLYNAVLLSDLKVKSRSPHSLPVPYVPLGRDAAVSFPRPDFAFENNTSHAIAIAAEYRPGQLTFRILGPAKSPYEMEFVSQHLGSWSHGVKYVTDPSLGYGEERVEDRGGNGQRVRTTRIVRQGGQVLRRDDLGVSTYSGGPRIVARNPQARRPEPEGESPGDAVPVEPTPPPPSAEIE